MPAFIDLTGHHYHHIIVLGPDLLQRRNASGKMLWRCLCDCGRVFSTAGKNLRAGNTQRCASCKEARRHTCHFVHGHTRKGKKDPLYVVYMGMIARCENPSHRGYADYGGRGITVCPRWRESFPAFLKDMGERPSPLHSIERHDNDGPYCPDNAYWADRLTQNRNSRHNVLLTWQGETHCLSEWAEVLHMNYGALKYRHQRGWSTERIFTTPRGRWPSQQKAIVFPPTITTTKEGRELRDAASS